MTDKDILDDFGSATMRMVRDRSLDKFEKIQLGTLKSQKGIELYDLLSGFDEEQKNIIKYLVAESIDNTIFNFLFMFEEDEDKNILVSGVNVGEISDGLSGELFTEDGWINRFSQK
ncbi:hypothetical protein EXT68_22295 [Pectobacterium parmentieri]|uniref:Uncharacterized protein n=1 Tax=Pectobacterium parmentieri TaxID=1905730 RepID=A0A0H3I388_PECPM|nr:hypothetical protein [Pectobacterium parmentieri]AFI90487.1 Hypothetical protein W5S_2399 [Pectobacterium parmentieri]AYH05889.1 hypothetical protein C5E25_11290 [Pectobacterium parmentieri]AYH14710.1 hypothetical protein C5E23_11260 [Pectobacterium parmentieri]AYH23411.1 hypothetical protein C5E21_11265 [Pectobacterium parmentieri]MBI0472005.1 hypothetical protein [Pectobacterium parmentieri]